MDNEEDGECLPECDTDPGAEASLEADKDV